MTDREVTGQKPILEWVSRDGPDASVRFAISEHGVSRTSGKSWRVTRETGRALGWVVLLGGLATGRSGWTGWGPTSHWLASKSEDRRLLRWKQIRRIDVDEKKGVILLCDSQGAEMRLCCTPATFEPALRLIRERTKT